MSEIVKICRKHGELTIDQVKKEVNLQYKCGFMYRCHQCKLDKDRKWKINNWEQHKEAAGKARQKARKLFRDGLIEQEPKANIWAREDKVKKPEKYKERSQKCKKKYWKRNSVHESLRQIGITKDVYDNLVEKHNGKCAICNKEETRKSRNGGICRLSIDHCHASGKVRGLLCHHCNAALGHLMDDTNLLQSAIQYLQSHQHKEIQ